MIVRLYLNDVPSAHVLFFNEDPRSPLGSLSPNTTLKAVQFEKRNGWVSSNAPWCCKFWGGGGAYFGVKAEANCKSSNCKGLPKQSSHAQRLSSPTYSRSPRPFSSKKKPLSWFASQSLWAFIMFCVLFVADGRLFCRTIALYDWLPLRMRLII